MDLPFRHPQEMLPLNMYPGEVTEPLWSPPERQRLCGMRKREREVGSGVAGDRRERGGVLT